MRVRLTFAKTASMRFTGHLDLHKTWERTLRRAGLPLSYSQGFSPHPRINLAAALPLGFTSECELVDFWLENDLPLPDITRALSLALPPGISILDVKEVYPRAPALQRQVLAAEYIMTILEQCPCLEETVDVLLSSPHLPRQWREKCYDLRPLVDRLEILPEINNHQRLLTHLSLREGLTGRPDEVLAALGIRPENAWVHRTRLFLAE
jgi:radical SAM-linked protein